VLGDLRHRQTVHFVRQDQPVGGLVEVVVRCCRRLAEQLLGAGPAPPGDGDPHLLRHVALEGAAQGVEHRAGVAAAGEHVVDDQQTVVDVEVVQQILTAMDPDVLTFADAALIALPALVGGPQGDVVALHPEGGQALLNHDAHRAAATPQADDEGGAKTALEDLPAEAKAIEHVILLGDEDFPGCIHGRDPS
jgi:hypothetical protein